MTIVEALKKFYKGNAQNEEKLREADSVLDAIRAKYGPYKGANVAEYIQNAIANGVNPESGGGGGDFSTAEVTITLESECQLFIPCLYCDVALVSGVAESGTYSVVLYKGMAFGIGRYQGGNEVTITVTGDAEADAESVYVTGDCTISVAGGEVH